LNSREAHCTRVAARGVARGLVKAREDSVSPSKYEKELRVQPALNHGARLLDGVRTPSHVGVAAVVWKGSGLFQVIKVCNISVLWWWLPVADGYLTTTEAGVTTIHLGSGTVLSHTGVIAQKHTTTVVRGYCRTQLLP
jgi:hypothetical protein